MDRKFDVVCIGSGPGGYVSAIRASQLGKKTAVVEIAEDKIGGVCLNEGCIPAKTIIRGSELYTSFKNCGSGLGFETKITKPNMEKLVAFSKEVVQNLRKGISYLFKKYGVTFIEGRAVFSADKEVLVELKSGGRQILKTENIILATGSRAKTAAGLEFDGQRIISSSEAVNLDYIPRSILIVGAGAIGIEFASLFNNLGAKVYIVETKSQILPQEDSDISRALKTIFKKRGIDIYNESKIVKVDKEKNLVKVEVAAPLKTVILEVDLVLVSAGRVPNTSFQNLSEIGLELNEEGFVKVDDAMKTTLDGVYAVGDITGKGKEMFAHLAYRKAEIAANSICGIKSLPINILNVPCVMYSDIQTASVGLNEEEVKVEGFDYVASKQYFRSNSRSVINCQLDGFVKIIADKKTRQFLGVHILGYEASEIIHQFVVAKSGGLLVDNMANFIYGHPTFAEIAKDSCLGVFDRPIHS